MAVVVVAHHEAITVSASVADWKRIASADPALTRRIWDRLALLPTRDADVTVSFDFTADLGRGSALAERLTALARES